MRTVAPLVLAVLATVLSVPAPAQAAGPLTVRAAKAYGKPVILPGKKTKVPVKIAVTGTRITDVDVTLERAGGRGFALVSDLKRVSGTAGDGVWRGTAVFDRNDWGGSYTIEVAATDGTSANAYHDFRVVAFKGAVKIRRAARLNVAAAPDSVRKGAKVRVHGVLRALGRKGTYAPLKRQRVEIWFRPKGKKKGTRIAVVSTDAKGRYSRLFTARKDGTVAARYKGTDVWQQKVTGWKDIDVR
ncbi:hypothetical protein [Actinocorallia populi]|uniref:hypothetical protein n=1 Tax=Actinocorallia populi TaxID=2079200 RepID=UPI000D088ED7|nr:hypothetical protein [Actinocorallia populi]